MSAVRPGMAGATRTCPHCKATILESSSVCPACRGHLKLDAAATDADLVLIDGRFRVACALEVLARCRPHAVLLFHDFWNRTPYHPVLAFTDWLGSCDSLAILRRKPSIDPAAFEAVRRLHRMTPD